MAQYDITYSCGHGGVERLFGKHAERERRIAYLEKHGLCPECLKRQHADAGRLSIEICRQAGLPDLDGSEKQVMWANQIRADALKIFDQLDASLVARAIDDRNSKAEQAVAEFALFELDDLRREMLERTTAKAWIDDRDHVTRGEIQAAVSVRLRPMRETIEKVAAEQSPVSREDQREIYRIMRASKLADLAAARKAEREAREAESLAAASAEAQAKRVELEKAAESEMRRWASRDATAAALLEAGIDDAEFTHWVSGSGERRIYVDLPSGRKIAFFVTGNRFQRPGSLDAGRWKGDAEKLSGVCATLADKYTGSVRFTVRNGKAVR